MDYYIEKFEKLQDELEDVLKNYPLFEEDVDYIFEHDIKDINELLDKNDEFYLKRAISKLEDLIKDIKDKSIRIKDIFREYDTLVSKWEKLIIQNAPSKVIEKTNEYVKKSSVLINKHNLDDLEEAIKLFNRAFKELKEYIK